MATTVISLLLVGFGAGVLVTYLTIPTDRSLDETFEQNKDLFD